MKESEVVWGEGTPIIVIIGIASLRHVVGQIIVLLPTYQ